jgi:hypothetical protein
MSERTKPLESDWARMPDPAGVVERVRMARKEQALQFAANVLPIIRDIQAAGHTSLNAIAGQLNARKVATANSGRWRHVQGRLTSPAYAGPPVRLECPVPDPPILRIEYFEQCGCRDTHSGKVCTAGKKHFDCHKKEPREVHAPGVSTGCCLSL